jgi:hypothetical protein
MPNKQDLLTNVFFSASLEATSRMRLAEWEHRLKIAEEDVVLARRVIEELQTCAQKHRNELGNALLDLMNSGISHRRYLKFIESMEAL